MSEDYQIIKNLKVSNVLLSFVNNELLEGTDISPEKFWSGFDDIIHNLAPINKKLIETREILQKKINEWHIENKDKECSID